MKRRRRPDGINFPRLILLAAFLFAVTPVFAATNAVEKLANSDCLDCHTDPSNTRLVNGVKVSVGNFPTNGFSLSVHSQLDCIDCHDGIKEMMHDKDVPPPNCTGCHEKEA